MAKKYNFISYLRNTKSFNVLVDSTNFTQDITEYLSSVLQINNILMTASAYYALNYFYLLNYYDSGSSLYDMESSILRDLDGYE